jgi:oligosaccharide repeat unit polymerase
MAFRVLQGSWLAPGAAWTGLWFFLTAMPLLMAPEYPCFPSGVWMILLLCTAVGAGSAIGCSLVKKPLIARQPAHPPLSPRQFRVLMLVSFAASIYSLQLLMQTSGYSIADLGSPTKLHYIAKTLSQARYEADDAPIFMRILLCYIYMCCLLGGYHFAQPQNRSWSRYYAFLPLLGSLIVVAATSARAGFLLSCVLWIGAYLPRHLAFASAKSITRSKWFFLLAPAVAAALVGLFVGAMFLRYGSETVDGGGFIFDRLKSYFAAHISVFSQWWHLYYHFEPPQMGRVSFFGPASLLGLTSRQAGVYDMLPVTIDGIANVDSNIFTVYRGLLEDFSLPGAILICLAGGIAAGHAFRSINVVRTQRTSAYVVLTVFYVVLGWSHVINPFGYSTLIAGVLGYALILSFAPLLSRTKRLHVVAASSHSHHSR